MSDLDVLFFMLIIFWSLTLWGLIKDELKLNEQRLSTAFMLFWMLFATTMFFVLSQQIQAMQSNTKIDIPIYSAEQQLIGYVTASKGYSVIDLITDMGLTQDEWQVIKANPSNSFLRDAKEFSEIEAYFKNNVQ